MATDRMDPIDQAILREMKKAPEGLTGWEILAIIQSMTERKLSNPVFSAIMRLSAVHTIGEEGEGTQKRYFLLSSRVHYNEGRSNGRDPERRYGGLVAIRPYP